MKFVIHTYGARLTIKPIDEAYFEDGEWCVDVDSLYQLLYLMEKYNDREVTITDSRPERPKIDIYDWREYDV